jgi:hypothetical protein
MSPDLGVTLQRGSEFAAATGATDVTLEHLLAALCDDPDAIAVLDASNVNAVGLRADVASQFLQDAASPTDASTTLGISQDVRRILEAAAAAARGSRRRDINGAIVLAAIVGDARSIAAEILQAHGLTFDGAIRALQSALAPSPAAPPRPVTQQSPADDVLARARERVQSRSTPSLRDIMKEPPRAVPHPPISAQDVAEPEGTAIPAPPTDIEPSAPIPASRLTPLPSLEVDLPSPRTTEIADHTTVVPHGGHERQDAPEPAFRPMENPRPAQAPTPGPALSGDRPAVAVPLPQPPSGPSLSFPSRPVHQPPDRAAAGAHPYPPEPPNLSSPQSGAAGGPGVGPAAPNPRGFPGDFPRPRPSGGLPPPIPPPPGSSMPAGPPGARGRTPGPMSAPVPMAPPGSSAGDPASRPEIQMDQSFPGARTPQQRPQPAPAKSAGRKRSKGAKVETGQLAENIPRAMRVGRTERVEVRIAKASVKALSEGLEGGGAAWQHQVTVTKAMAVRMRAPEGGFFIETASPETQWIENNIGYTSDDFASWRFLIMPQSRGWSRLQIIVSARSVGADGMAAETALPDQVVEVKVRRNLKRTFARLLGWTVAAILGGALATFGATGIAVMKILVLRLIH